ncbi:uncharacterized protein BKA55DRAFT_586104 [Fusarium redolens]|uniref:Uncharacterized protein n=1 Tax=Fusarium redolens TaxID=48865 RepID=A0A9P9JT51_FUSRE|nr:uncharacterized protein BKA55DRAFT_586104 [Fusarium redolens]KAH7208435.1 hypothetical protein BKA55DRAFT_586104 [Fusarium redolens]
MQEIPSCPGIYIARCTSELNCWLLISNDMDIDMDTDSVWVNLVPGLERELQVGDVCRSRTLQNKLSKDSDIQPIDEKHIAYLGRLIEECNAKEVFGIHLGHKHFDLREGTYLAGGLDTDDNRQYYWTRAVENDGFDPSKLCGHIFIYDREEGFGPSEFHQGSLPDLSTVDRRLFPTFGRYLTKHMLEHNIALEYLIPELRGRDMFELVLHEQQHILLCEPEIVLPSLGDSVVTAYSYVESGVAFGPGTRYITPPGTNKHITFNPDDLIELKEVIDVFRKLEFLGI